MSDHQLIFCTSKVKQAKFNKHRFNKIDFLNYERFSCIEGGYNDFLNKLMKVVNQIAPSKEIRIKNSTQEWFDREIAELIHAEDFFFNV